MSDIKRTLEIEEEHADLHRRVLECARAHGMTEHRRLYGEDGFLDVDEWRDARGREAFLHDAAELLAELSAARGSGPPEVSIWHERPRPGAPDERREELQVR
jgi:hypothetical protein